MMNWNVLNSFPMFAPWQGGILFILVIWSLVWKGLALWKSARREQTAWFVVMLVVNTLGVLEILYLYVFEPDKKHQNRS